MRGRFRITDHALTRFAERHTGFDELGAKHARQVFLAELDRAHPFGGQMGNDELLLLPCDYVAVIGWREGVAVVKTVLTKDQAIANMQSQGAVLRPSARIEKLLAPVPSAIRAGTEEARLRSALRLIAEKHLQHGVGKNRRNVFLRELGYDPAGKAGDIYRAEYQALLEAQYAKRRAEHFAHRQHKVIQASEAVLPRPNEELKPAGSPSSWLCSLTSAPRLNSGALDSALAFHG